MSGVAVGVEERAFASHHGVFRISLNRINVKPMPSVRPGPDDRLCSFSCILCGNFHSEMIQKHEVCIRIFGDISLLPQDVQEAVAKCVNLSRNNKRCVWSWSVGYKHHRVTTVEASLQRPTLMSRDIDGLYASRLAKLTLVSSTDSFSMTPCDYSENLSDHFHLIFFDADRSFAELC